MGDKGAATPLLRPRFDTMPVELRVYRQWVVWEAVWLPDKAKYSKIPYNARTGRRASSTDPDTWSSFDEARMAYERNPLKGPARVDGQKQVLRYAGVGFVLWKKPPLPEQDGKEEESVFQDHVARWESWPESDPFVGIDLDDGIPAGERARWIEHFDTYTEVSPSGTGIRMFVMGKLPPHGRKEGAIEVYESGRFLTVTGHVWDTVPGEEDLPDGK